MRTKKNYLPCVILTLALSAMCLVSGCALLQPPTVIPAAPAPPSPQIATALDSAGEILAELKALQSAPAIAPTIISAPAPTTAIIPAATTTAVSPPTTAPADKEAEILSLLTTAMQQLNMNLQNAPTTQAQQQAAINTGIQTAQGAALTFGGQYGALIAAGLGILSVLIQGMVNTNKAHQTAQAANATAQTLAGKLPPHQA